MIEIFYIMFVVMFDYQGITSEMNLQFDTEEQCFEHVRKVDEDPTVLYFEGRNVTNIKYGCIRYLRNFVEECEVLPHDVVNKKECIPYWNHWAKHSRSESGTYTNEE